MNNINKIFDKIKASNELKEKAYEKIRNNKRYSYKNIIISVSLALASILIIFTLINYDEKPVLSPTNEVDERLKVSPSDKSVDFNSTEDAELYTLEKETTNLTSKGEEKNSIIYIIISGLSGVILGATVMYFIKVKKNN